MPSRYNSATLPYTSRSREHIYPVYAVKLLAPAILLWSPMSIRAGRSGSTKVDAKMGMRVRLGPSDYHPLLALSASRSAHDDTVRESKSLDVSKSVQ